MAKPKLTYRANAHLARYLWGEQSRIALKTLKTLTGEYSFSIQAGDLQQIDGKWYVTHTGLLRLATSKRCCGISTSVQQKLSDPAANRWVFRAVVFKNNKSKGFVAFADADPGNVSALVHGAELRIAETRAVNRALRKAYGIGLCSVEELGAFSTPSPARTASSSANGASSLNGSHKINQPRLRDQLCLLIRRFKLDPNLVKGYAADFCGTQVVSEASRESLEAFVLHLRKAAEENREALVCKLNSYAARVEVGS
jgi:hypothetical protein